MAKKKATRRKSTAVGEAALDAARAGVDQAREQMERAEELYSQVKERAASEADKLRNSSSGENLDRFLGWVRKHPGAGVMGAATVGFVLGRIFRR
ncbi:MAG: hypothetical protein QGG36_30490 [Pirellulaceae bacterium]|nr:hypothetical protein [Pirellulaceae bacterium]MDP7020166.1 hypothetical protein [Pirellulaceae bacterium]